uniref:Fibronectin type III domain containing 4a n=1 Tax=Seriola dumerili TaxID=41447 RepID=A0A3B4UMU9_SERDU
MSPSVSPAFYLSVSVSFPLDRPPAPVNVSVMHLRADSATVSWEVPEGDIIIGFSISQQRQDGHMQRFIREVNTTSRSCVLWDLEEETDYIIQVQSIGLYGESQASKKVHFRTLKKSDRFPSNSSNQDDPTVQGLDKSRHLQTGEMIIIVVVLVMWAAVIALFCRQYDIIKDNDSSNNKEKAKPSSERSTPEHHSGGLLRSKVSENDTEQSLSIHTAVLLPPVDVFKVSHVLKDVHSEVLVMSVSQLYSLLCCF